jgi:hydrogenase maturation protease
MKKTVVLGCGNELMGDEGVGVHVARLLEAKLSGSAPNIRVIDGGTSPDFCHLLDGAEKLVIVDAVKGGCEPGTVYRFSPDQIVAEEAVATSVHQIGVLDNLKMMELTGNRPAETVIIGVEPARIELGLELSPGISERMSDFVRVVLEEIGLPFDEMQTTNEAKV